ncbi:MAG: DMT family transporter [Flavobacteriales bacterium]|nr:DMT family transporter [Flavobacteriales bacterium]
MLISTAAFSLMQLCVKFLSHLPTHELILFRSGISLILSLAYLLPKGIHPLGNNRKFLLLRGVFGVTALSLFFITLQNLPLASAVTVQYLSPIFTAIIAIFLLGERMKMLQWFFFGLAFLGVALLKGFDERVSVLYLGLGVLSAFFAGAAYNCIRMVKDTDHPLVVVLYFPMVATPIMLVLSYFEWVTPIGWDWALILLLGVFTQIGQVFMTKALQAEKANVVASLKYLGSLYALVFGYFIFNETYNWISIVGIVLILSGVLLNVLAKNWTNEKPHSPKANEA